MGANDGSIIATIMATHMPRKAAAAPSQVCPGIRIQAIDIVQPPGMGIPPWADMRAHQRTVTAEQAAKSSAAAPRKALDRTIMVNSVSPLVGGRELD
jgi:hypothetical protein